MKLKMKRKNFSMLVKHSKLILKLQLTFLLFLTSSISCEEVEKTDHVELKKVDLNYLDTIIFNVPAHLIITQGRKNFYSIEGSQESLRHIKVSLIPGGDLKIEPKELDIGSHNVKNLTVYITVKDLQKLHLGKFVKASARGLNLKKLNLNIQDNAIFRGDLTLDDLFVEIKGSPLINLKGSANRQSIDIHGNADYLASKFKTSTTVLNVHGGGEINVKATKQLTVSLVGDAKISYSGNPKKFEQKVSGKGVIRKVK